MSRTRLKKGLIAVAAALLLAAVCEIALSNGGYFLYHRRGDSPVTLTETAPSSTALSVGDCYMISEGGGQLDLTVNAPVHTLQFTVFCPFELPDDLYMITVGIAFPGDEERFLAAHSAQHLVGEQERVVTVRIPAKFDHTATALRIVSPKDAMLCYKNITVNPAYRFSFHALRFGIIAFLFAALALTAALGLFHVPFDFKKPWHRVFAVGIAALCVGCALLFVTVLKNVENEPIAYPLENGVESYNPYVQQFDAWMKGQAALDVKPSEELLSLQNPYDKESRKGISALWDRALYNGKYYSYFGFGPLLTVYAPYYAVTGNLPADGTVTAVFTVMAALFWCLAVFAWVTVFHKSVSLPLLGFGTVAGLFATGLFLLQRGRQPFYFIAVLSAAAFLCAFAFFALLGFHCKRKVLRQVLLAAAGLSFGLGFLCRVNTMIPAGVIITAAVLVYIISAIKDGRRFSGLLPDLFSLALPVVAAAGSAFAFNYIRFGSPFEFGATYQLTVSDISQNKIYIGGIAGALYHYFFQKWRVEDIFPYIRLSTTRMPDYGRGYTYVDSNCGIFNIPLFFVLPFGLSSLIHRKNHYEAPVILTGIASLFITAFLDFCLGGVIFRYVGDISFTGAFLCLAVMFHLLPAIPYKNKTLCILRDCGQAAGVLISALTILLGGALAISTSANLLALSPKGYEAIAALFAIT